jgi:hypothetical protein
MCGKRKLLVALAMAIAATWSVVAGYSAGTGSNPRQLTALCDVRTFTISFNPNKSTVVSSHQVELVRISFDAFRLRASCRRIASPRAYRHIALTKIRRHAIRRCTAPRPIKIHLNSIINGDSDKKERIGNAVVVGFGEPLTIVASAILKNKGDPLASSLYSSRRYCAPA